VEDIPIFITTVSITIAFFRKSLYNSKNSVWGVDFFSVGTALILSNKFENQLQSNVEYWKHWYLTWVRLEMST